jgi:hypothetical protein
MSFEIPEWVKQWKNRYTLADIIRFRFAKGKNFKDSIGYEYISNLEDSLHDWDPKLGCASWRLGDIKNVDWELLKSICLIKQKSNYKNLLNIHLRLGDTLKESLTQKKIVDIIVENELNVKHKECNLIYGFHNTKNKAESNKWIFELEVELKKLFPKINHTSTNVDEDFLTLINSEDLILSHRGFSWLAGCMCRGKVFWDAQSPPKFKWSETKKVNKNEPDNLNFLLQKQLIDGFKYYQLCQQAL